MPFTVLALGDTNYDKFCHMGKSIDRRLTELGGKKFVELHCADEAVGLEETVEGWRAKVISAIIAFRDAEQKTFQLRCPGEEDEVGDWIYSLHFKRSHDTQIKMNRIQKIHLVQVVRWKGWRTRERRGWCLLFPRVCRV